MFGNFYFGVRILLMALKYDHKKCLKLILIFLLFFLQNKIMNVQESSRMMNVRKHSGMKFGMSGIVNILNANKDL